ncbi:MAG TPA: MoxR family ATPase [Candidatus Gastranaerophilales bacterium]|nr:MoxR family ATPase [Candidatus Gastranaerophilales bacterium]
MTDIIESEVKNASEKFKDIIYEIKKVIVGQHNMVEKTLVAILADGHILIEGAPGLAKTLTLKTIAKIIDADFKRIQFTPDLLPADLTGTRIFNQNQCDFSTSFGPIFANLILADEINRAPAKVQSALLEAMQEKQVTIGKESFKLKEPFLVLATQNPIETEGTYNLPEAQLDRFMFKVIVDYPDEKEETAVVERMIGGKIPEVNVLLNCDSILNYRNYVNTVYVDPKLIHYIVEIVSLTRNPAKNTGLSELKPFIQYGSSPRGSLAITQASKAIAFMRGRTYITIDDIKSVVKECLRHRIILSYEGLAEGINQDFIIDKIVSGIETPFCEIK